MEYKEEKTKQIDVVAIAKTMWQHKKGIHNCTTSSRSCILFTHSLCTKNIYIYCKIST